MAENEMNKGLSQVSIRLVQESPLLSDESINTPEQAVKVLGEWLEGMDRELVCVLNLQADLKPINMNIVSMGALNEAQVHPREVMKSAILSNAACMMLLHNHPSGSLKPSKEDVKVTDMMHQVGNLLQIPLVDHIIIGKNKQFYSIRDQEDYDIPKPSYISDINQLKWPQTMLKEEQFYQDKSNASENKARKLEEIMDELEQGVQSILTSENYMNYLKFLSSFHSYSLNNTILIYHQKPDASFVAGYRKWQSLGRQVQQFHALRYTKGEEYGGRYELIAGNCLIGPTSENPYLTKPAVSQAIKDAKNYLEQKEKSHEKQGKHLKITERSKTLPTKKVKEQER